MVEFEVDAAMTCHQFVQYGHSILFLKIDNIFYKDYGQPIKAMGHFPWGNPAFFLAHWGSVFAAGGKQSTRRKPATYG